MAITITIKSSGDAKYEVSIEPTITILQLKEEIATKADITPDRQRLIYSGKVLKDGDTVESYKVQSGHTIHLVKSAAKTSAPASAESAAVSTTNATGVPSSISAGQGSFNPMADLTGARYAGYTQLPSASMFGPDGGMSSGMPDPEQLSQMMSDPMLQQQMNSMLSNPQMLDYIIQQTPQLRAMGPQAREMLQSPFFRQMMSNPEMMRGMMDMSRGQMGGMPNASAFPAPGNPNGETSDASTGTGTGTGSATGTGATGTDGAANPFANMFPGGMPPINPFMFGAGGANAQEPAQQDTRPPEERYETQLRQLNDMGFFEFDRNIEALRRTGGSVQGAIEYLLSNN